MAPMGELGSLEGSEEKRSLALQCIERAGTFRENGDDEGAVEEVEAAMRALESALEICYANHRARFLLVSCLMSNEEFARAKKEALIIYEGLTEEQLKAMDDPLLHLSIAHACKVTGAVADAVKYAEEATLFYPSNPQPLVALGELKQQVGDHAAAEQCFTQALLRSDDPACRHPLKETTVVFVLCGLAKNLVKLKKYLEAEKFAIRAVQLDPDSTLSLKQLAEVYYWQNRLPEALQICRRAAQEDPEDGEVLQRLDMLEQRCASQETIPSWDELPMAAGRGPRSPRVAMTDAKGRRGGSSEGGSFHEAPAEDRRKDCMICCMER